MSNPFAVDAWEVGEETATQYLTAGNHVVTVAQVDGTTTSSGGYPQIELRLENENGSIRDWLVITPATFGKIAQVIQALGADLPDEHTQVSQDDHRIEQSYLDSWKGKKVGIIARDEPAYNDPTKMRTRIKGYIAPEKLADMPPAPVMEAKQSQAFGTGNSAINDDIPF